MGPVVIGLVAPLVAALKQKLSAYALMAVAGLIVIFSAGYALNAVHSLLMLRYGGVAASLAIAGALLLAAVINVCAAFYLKYRPAVVSAAAKASSPFSNPPFRSPIRWNGVMAAAAAVAGAATAAAAILTSERLRNIMRGRDSHGPDV